jgi:hypothetical protein
VKRRAFASSLALAAGVILACSSGGAPAGPGPADRVPPADAPPPTRTPNREAPPDGERPPGLTDAESAQVAVLQSLADGEPDSPHFVCVEGKDASPAVMDALARETRGPLRGCNAWSGDARRVGTPYDPASRTAGVVIDVGRAVPVGENGMRIEGGYSCGNLCSARFRFTLRRRGSQWEIVSRETIAVS